MKIRIFALAKELGFDSKDLIQHCNDAGLDVKSSPLASITPAERDVLMQHLKALKSKPSAGVSATPSMEIAREEPRREFQGREIRDLSASAQMKMRRPPPRKDLPASEPEIAAPEPEPAPAPVVVEAAPEAPAPEPAPVVEVLAAPEPVAPVEVPEVVSEAAPTVTPEPEVEKVEPESAPAPDRPAPITRSDYVSPTRAASPIREMKPHGSVRITEDRPLRTQVDTPPIRRDKKRGPALPALATPTFKPTVAKKTEEPIHKPDLALTGDVLKKNKLADILKKNRDESVRRTPGIEEEEKATPAKGRGAAARGLGLEEAREARRRRRAKTKGGADEDEGVILKTVKRQRRGSSTVERKTSAVITTPISVRSLSEELGRPARDLLTILFAQGKMVTINDLLDEEIALEIAMELGVDLQIEQEEDFEDVLASRLSQDVQGGDVETAPRPPIITVLGHVDHGKTTLVDRIRTTNVAAGEAGGITQHIAAYQVEHGGQKLTFVDTPGHAAFGEMRARGANVTDIIVLVVAADDGVMPQTVECISHAKAANVPIVVAMNKCDLPGINEQRVLTELSQHGILPAEWGGDVEVVRVSGLVGTGVDKLLETLLVTAELSDFRTPVGVPADGVCLEAFRDEGRGPIAWAIVRMGTLRVGDLVLCGPAYGRVRAMYTDRGEEIQEAGPSTPVKIAGLDEVPGAGDHLYVMDDIEQAREFAEERRTRGRTAALSGRGGPMSLEEFFASKQGGGVKDLPLIIKADAPGSLEAIRGELEKFDHPEVRIKILHTGVGGVNESDVYLAASTGAIVVAFHVIAEDRAEALAAQEGVEIRRYRIIYNVTDDIRQALEGLLEPEKVEVATGRALVLQTFGISRVGTVAGCRILNGTIDRNNRVHVIRDQTVLNHYAIASLKRGKDDVREVREGFECGIRLDGFNDVKEGDLLEAYKIEERKRTLEE
ncbi:translation initiation factor IF-2 [Planctomicrobium sp. SH661]|uniref:translation initiation factor IF-2 n=1 Tax=Planctomicrobium sp. SH661 TaxID=3448124 RepID=UPI003F5B6F9C